MPRGLPARSRLLSCSVWAAIAAVLAGCSTAPPAPTVSGKTLTVYVSAPSSLSSDPQAQDVIDAEKLAFTQLSHTVSGFTVNLRVVTSSKVSDNARAAIEDKTSVAYLGEVQPGASINSLGITNAQDLIQVSPTQAGSVPTKDFESYSTYGRTFASMSPISDQELRAMLAGSAGKAFVRAFRSAYGHAPSPQAIFGYAAMAVVLKALQKAGAAASNRGTVHDDFFALKRVPLLIGAGGPQLGTYTVNSGGTVTITPGAGSAAP